MSQAEPKTQKNPTWREQLVIGATEIMFLIGLACFCGGLWILAGAGPALLGTGCILIIAAMINAQARDASPERKNAI